MGTAEMNTGDEKTVVISSDLSKTVSYQTSIRGCLNSEDAIQVFLQRECNLLRFTNFTVELCQTSK